MAALPYMQFYVADYLSDTAHLRPAEHGAYLLLIFTYWQRGKPLPDDDRKLARIARMSDDEWADVRDVVEEFFQVRDGLWRHKRIDNDLAKVAEKSQKARKAREQRTINEQSADEPTNVDTTVDAREGTGEATNEQRPSYHTDTDTDNRSNYRSTRGTRVSGTSPRQSRMTPAEREIETEFENWWQVYPRRVGKGQARTAYRRARTKIDYDPLMQATRAAAERLVDKDPQFIPHPATWLNGERWLDDPPDKPPNGEEGEVPPWGYVITRGTPEQRARVKEILADKTDPDRETKANRYADEVFAT